MVDVGLDAVTVGHLPEGLGLKEIGEGLGAGIVMEAADTDVLLCRSGVACGRPLRILRLGGSLSVGETVGWRGCRR